MPKTYNARNEAIQGFLSPFVQDSSAAKAFLLPVTTATLF